LINYKGDFLMAGRKHPIKGRVGGAFGTGQNPNASRPWGAPSRAEQPKPEMGNAKKRARIGVLEAKGKNGRTAEEEEELQALYDWRRRLKGGSGRRDNYYDTRFRW
jgi:hypothetical protein